MNINKSVIKGLVICKRKRNEVAATYLESVILGIMNGDIPEWILIEVLIRLPVKLIFRLKLVCKHWLSLISDPSSFARMYISRASPLQQPWVIVSRYKEVDWSPYLDIVQCESPENIYCRELKCSSYLLLHVPSPRTHLCQLMPRICGISNGLALCARIVPSCRTDFYERTIVYNICNPVTRQGITLVPPACHFDGGSFGFQTQVEDGMLKSYRVVCVDLCFQTPNTIRFHVFFSESGEWKIFNVLSALEIEIVGKRPPADLHGNLHWILQQNGILAYDPYRKPNGLRIIPLPYNQNQEYNQPMHCVRTSLCGVSDGKLRYFEVSPLVKHPRGFSIWILNDYSSGDWSLQNRVEHIDVLSDAVFCHPKMSILPIIFDPFDSDIVYFGHLNLIVPYNIKTKRSVAPGANELIIKHGLFYEQFQLRWWMGLVFFIPPWPTSIPGASVGSIEK